MSGVRRALMAGHVLLAVAVWGMAVAGASRWPGTNFPGFLLLDNRVVASAGLAHWPGIADGALFQAEVLAADGQPVTSARDLSARGAQRAGGDAIRWTVRRAAGG